MKSYTRGAMALACIAALVGCSTVGPSNSIQTGTSAGQIKVAFISQVEGIPYFSGFNTGATQEAQKLGVSYTQNGPSTADSAQQLQIFNSMVLQGYSAISISPLDPASMNSAIAAARQKGVIVLTSDADAPDSARQAFVSQATDQALGQTVMDQIGQATGGTGQYGIISGGPDTDTFTKWINAIQAEQAAKYPAMQLVGGIRYTTTTAQALTETQNLITAYPTLAGVIAIPSTAVPGVAQAVANAGDVGKIAVSGFGSPQTAAPYLKNGSMTSTVLWDVPQLGALTVWAMVELVNGRSFQASNSVPGFANPVSYDAASKTLVLGPPMVFTKANCDQYNY